MFIAWPTALLILLMCGCGLVAPARMPEAGPSGIIKPEHPAPSILERLSAPPDIMTDLDATAGILFEAVNKEKWPDAETTLGIFNQQWLETKNQVGDKKGVKEADEAFGKLAAAVHNNDAGQSYENLNRFMGSVSDIAKNYKLSPLTDIIAMGNAVRDAAYYNERKDWQRAKAKAKALDETWGQVKPAMEQVGVLGEVTKTHSAVKQTKDALEGENKGGAEDHLADLNKSLGKLREYYRGK